MKNGYLIRMLEMLTSAYIRFDVREDIKAIENDAPPKTHIGKLFAVLAWAFEIVHGAFTRIREWDDLEKATGTVLDRYGKNYGVKRDGTDDDFYRVMIAVKMISQLSGGDTDTVIEAAASLYDLEPEKIEVMELYPAKGRLYISAADITEEKRKVAGIISQLMKRIVALGVGIETVFHDDHFASGTIYAAGYTETVIETAAPLLFNEAAAVSSVVFAASTAHTQIYHRIKGVDNYAGY